MKYIVSTRKTQIQTSEESGYIAEPLERKISQILETGSGIEQTLTPEYGEEYNEMRDIRTDKWDVAIDSLNKKVSKEEAAKTAKIKQVEAPKTEEKTTTTTSE